MEEFRLEADRAARGTAVLRHLRVGAGGVPGEADEGGALVLVALDHVQDVVSDCFNLFLSCDGGFGGRDGRLRVPQKSNGGLSRGLGESESK